MKRLAIFLLIPLLTACSKKNGDYVADMGNIYKIEAPETGTAGSIIRVKVMFYGGNNGCAKPYNLEHSVSGSTVYIKAFYIRPTKPAICTMAIPKHTLYLDYKPAQPGTYTFRSFDSSASASTRVN